MVEKTGYYFGYLLKVTMGKPHKMGISKEISSSIPVSRSFLFPGNPCKMGAPGFFCFVKSWGQLGTVAPSI